MVILTDISIVNGLELVYTSIYLTGMTVKGHFNAKTLRWAEEWERRLRE